MRIRNFALTLIAVIIACHITGCGENEEFTQRIDNYDSTVQHTVNQMVRPVTLVGKDKSWGLYGITVMGGDGTLFTISNISDLANQIGSSRKIGDTIR